MSRKAITNQGTQVDFTRIFGNTDFVGCSVMTKRKTRGFYVPCEVCKSRDTYVYCTRGVFRWIKCNYCSHSFKTMKIS